MENVFVGKKVDGSDRETFLKEMDDLWTAFESIGLDRISAFRYAIDKPIEVTVIAQRGNRK